MSWLKIDDNFPDHPKIETLTDRAFRLHISGLAHCAKYLTDGKVPLVRVPRLVGYTKKALVELVDANLWHPAGDAYELHDYLDWNRSRKQVLADRDAAAERQKKRRESRRDSTRESHDPDQTRPDQTEGFSPTDKAKNNQSGIFVRLSDGSRLHLTSWVASLGKSDLTIGRPTRPLRHSPVTAGLLSDLDLGSATLEVVQR